MADLWGSANQETNQTLMARSFLRFNMAPIAGQQINGASLNLYEHHSFNCDTSQTVQAYRVASGTFPGYMSWSGPTPGELLGGKAFAHGNTCAPGWDAIPLDYTIVSKMANGQLANTGFVIKAVNETTNAGWKKFHSAQGAYPPRLTVATPVNRPPTGSLDGVVGSQGRVRVTGWAWDPDSPAQSINVAVYFKTATTSVLDKWYLANALRTDVPGVVPGTSNNQGFDLSIEWPPGTYSVCVHGIDTSGGTNPQINCGNATITAPAVPTVPRTPAAVRDANGGANVSWTVPASDGGRRITQYTIKAWVQSVTGTWSDTGKQTTCAACTATSFANLALGRPHAFTITASNAVGASGAATTPVVTPATKPATPTAATAKQDGTTATIEWTKGPDNGSPYTQVAVGAFESPTGAYSGLSSTVSCSTTSCSNTTIPGLDPAKGYTFLIWAYNAVGFSDGAQTNSVPTVPSTPGTPQVDLLAAPIFGGKTVTWTRSTFDGGRPISKYTVYATRSSDPNAVVTKTCDQECANARRVSFDNLAPSEQYTFAVTATNAVGTGPRSAESQAAPADPGSVLATDGPVVAARGDGEATVSWPQPELVFPLITAYELKVYKADDPTASPTMWSAGPAGNDCGAVAAPCTVVKGLKNGTRYNFSVITKTGIDPVFVRSGESGRSNTVTPAGRPFVPESVAIKRENGSFLVSWQPPKAQGDIPGDNGDRIVDYLVSATAIGAPPATPVSVCGADPSSCANGAATSMRVTGLNAGTTYRVEVYAKNTVGTSDASAPVVAEFATAPAKPAAPSATAGDRSVTLTWSQPARNGSDVIDYEVIAIADNGGRMSMRSSTTSATFRDLVAQQGYRFAVSARNEVGVSEPSDLSPRVQPFGPPSAPANLLVQAGDQSIRACWQPSAEHGTPVTSYRATISPAHAAAQDVPRSSSLCATFSGLTNGTEYSISVVAKAANTADGPAAVQDGVPEPAPLPSTVSLKSTYKRRPIGFQGGVTLRAASSGLPIHFAVTSGPNAGANGTCHSMLSDSTCATDSNGYLYFRYVGAAYGTDTVEAFIDSNQNSVRDAGEATGSVGVRWDDAVRYVALGDSFSSGEGAEDYAAGTDTRGVNQCHRSNNAYSTLAKWGPYTEPILDYAGGPVNWNFFACSGARMFNVRKTANNGEGQWDNEPPQLDQVASLPYAPNMLTMSISGNDMGFVDILVDCATSANCTSNTHAYKGEPNLRAWFTERLDDVRAELTTLLGQVKAQNPDSAVFLMGYPILFPPTGSLRQQPEYCPKLTPWFGEMDGLNELTHEFNSALRQVAESQKVWFVDVEQKFADHYVCHDDEWLIGPGPSDISEAGRLDDFHPNRAGQRAYAERLESVINARIREGAVLNEAGLPLRPGT